MARLQIGAEMQKHGKTAEFCLSSSNQISPSLISDLMLRSPKCLFKQLLGSRGRNVFYIDHTSDFSKFSVKNESVSNNSSVHFYLLLSSSVC